MAFGSCRRGRSCSRDGRTYDVIENELYDQACILDYTVEASSCDAFLLASC